MSITKQYTAFTLAEVLITLAIIGVVAAMTVPNLLKNTQNTENISAAKKALYVANQAYSTAQIDNGGGFGADDSQAVAKFNAIKSQLKVIKDCPYGSNAKGQCWSSSGVGLKNWQVTDCGATSNNSYQNDNASFITPDGMFWMLYSYSSTTAASYLFVDVNGNKGPNDWGKDVFIFNIGDTNINPFNYTCSNNLKHNDGTTVDTLNEFMAPFK